MRENLGIFLETDVLPGSTWSPLGDSHYLATLVGWLFWVSGWGSVMHHLVYACGNIWTSVLNC